MFHAPKPDNFRLAARINIGWLYSVLFSYVDLVMQPALSAALPHGYFANRISYKGSLISKYVSVVSGVTMPHQRLFSTGVKPDGMAEVYDLTFVSGDGENEAVALVWVEPGTGGLQVFVPVPREQYTNEMQRVVKAMSVRLGEDPSRTIPVHVLPAGKEFSNVWTLYFLLLRLTKPVDKVIDAIAAKGSETRAVEGMFAVAQGVSACVKTQPTMSAIFNQSATKPLIMSDVRMTQLRTTLAVCQPSPESLAFMGQLTPKGYSKKTEGFTTVANPKKPVFWPSKNA
jgi:hypothetical protein